MHIRDLNGKTVCVLGFGREGQATLKALERETPEAHITIADERADVTLPEDSRHRLQIGAGWLQNLGVFDVIIKSPGIPPKPEFDAVRGKITNATQIFLDTVAEAGSFVIGVTGSKGKSTTSSLLHAILQTAGLDAFLVGNIGIPALDALPKAAEGTFFVCEMSSYQLSEITRSPQIAVITSFFPEHLDYHGSLDAYWEAKARITQFQTPDDLVFFPESSEGAAAMAERSPGKKVPVTDDQAAVALELTKLIGSHNRTNMALACAVARFLKVQESTIVEACTSFQGLPHRLQSLGIVDGIEWVDDAISTTPESAIAAIDALGDRVTTIILGGQDRGSDFQELAQRIRKSLIHRVILFPGSGERIGEALKKTRFKGDVFPVTTMEEAVDIARKKTPQGHICLLSTASPSYGMFKNFEEKGDRFAACVRKGQA